MKARYEAKLAALRENLDKITACEELERILGDEAAIRKQAVRGGLGVGISSSGNTVMIPTPNSNITSYDKDTNRLLRAQTGCQLGLFKSPLSSEQSIYVNEENYNIHLQEANKQIKELEDNPPRKKWFIM